MDLTPQTLREVEFREKLRGYHPDDVDDFLEEAATALEALLARLSTGNTAVVARPDVAPAAVEAFIPPPPVAPIPPAVAPAPPSRPASEDVTDDTLRRTLVLAQRTADLAVAEAEDAAREILEHAQNEATRIRDEAKAKADAVVAEIETRRAGLEREIAALQGWAVQHRDRLSAALTEQVRSLDVWLATSTPPASTRAGFGRTPGSGARRTLNAPSPRALSTTGDEAGNGEAPAEPEAAEAQVVAAGEAETAVSGEPGFSTRVFRRR